MVETKIEITLMQIMKIQRVRGIHQITKRDIRIRQKLKKR